MILKGNLPKLFISLSIGFPNMHKHYYTSYELALTAAAANFVRRMQATPLSWFHVSKHVTLRLAQWAITQGAAAR